MKVDAGKPGIQGDVSIKGLSAEQEFTPLHGDLPFFFFWWFWASHLLGRQEIGSHKLFAQDDFEPQSS
jgi:hypothetical protein